MSSTINPCGGVAFLAYPEMKERLLRELSHRFSSKLKNMESFGELVYCPEWILENGVNATPYGSYSLPYWACTTYLDPFFVEFDSIGDAAKSLKDIQRNWASYQFENFRRATLIQEKLPYINTKIKKFPFSIPDSPIGAYTLIHKKKLMASAKTSSFLPIGRLILEEDHENPPSRAYLKLQEALIRVSSKGGGCFRKNENGVNEGFAVALPHEGMRCFDAGGCPGGWTWVLRELNCDVVAVDRSELAPALMNDSHVTFMKHDAFTLDIQEMGKFDWFFSDVICYPEKLYEWVTSLLSSGMLSNMICTIKMQGEIDWNVVEKFARIPNSSVLHLNYNKHELTWIHTA